MSGFCGARLTGCNVELVGQRIHPKVLLKTLDPRRANVDAVDQGDEPQYKEWWQEMHVEFPDKLTILGTGEGLCCIRSRCVRG